MNRRPRPFTVIGWLFIVVGSAGILKDLLPMHLVIFAPLLYFLFRPQSAAYFGRAVAPGSTDPVPPNR